MRDSGCGLIKLGQMWRRWVIGAALAFLMVQPAHAQTVLTGDRIDGTPVIDALDANDLATGKVHRFWFRVSDNAIGQAWYVPVIVVRGARPGHRLLLTAGIHGDELNGIDVIHRLVRTIDPTTLAGTIVAVPGLNTPGLLHHTRAFTPGDGVDGDNLNRLMPGDPAKTDRGNVYALRLWTRLLRPNADTAIDLHTHSPARKQQGPPTHKVDGPA